MVSIWKTLTPLSASTPAHAVHRVVDRAVALARIHVRLGVQHRVDVVVVLQAAVAGQAHRHGLVSAVHGHQVDVDVDDQVGLGGALGDLDQLALIGRADLEQRAGSSASKL